MSPPRNSIVIKPYHVLQHCTTKLRFLHMAHFSKNPNYLFKNLKQQKSKVI